MIRRITLMLCSIMLLGCASELISLKPVIASYDRFDNETTYKAKQFVAKERLMLLPMTLYTYAYKVCNGNMVNCDSEHIHLVFTYSAKDWWFNKYPVNTISLKFITDGETIDAGFVQVIGTDVLTTGGVHINETMSIVINKTDFLKIAFAQSLEGKLGSEEFSIDYEKRDRWRALVNPTIMNQILNN